jgi:predicted small secreted protein
MDLNKILKDLDENNKKNKSIDDSFIYSLLIDEEYLIQLNSLILKSDKYCINFLLNDIINTFDYEKTILYKLIRFSIKNSEYVDYIFLIKKIIKNESFLKYIENTDLWFVNIDTEFNYLENEQFLNTIFGCLCK